jgi:hypothetical protein
MNTLNTLPGFTAEASLCNVSTRYQVTTEATVHGGLVQPAGPTSDYATLDNSLSLLFGPVYTPRPRWCFKWHCIQLPNQNPHCFQTLGFWNSATQRCE